MYHVEQNFAEDFQFSHFTTSQKHLIYLSWVQINVVVKDPKILRVS